jgi:hypothetical protein
MAWVLCGLSDSGFPVLRPREVELWAANGVVVGTLGAQWPRGRVSVTTHRIVWCGFTV